MKPEDIVVQIGIRPLWQRILRFPFVFWKYYSILRDPYRGCCEGRLVCVYGAWILAGVTVSK